MIGMLWEEVSEGQGLFMIAAREVDGLGVRDQLLRKIETGDTKV